MNDDNYKEETLRLGIQKEQRHWTMCWCRSSKIIQKFNHLGRYSFINLIFGRRQRVKKKWEIKSNNEAAMIYVYSPTSSVMHIDFNFFSFGLSLRC